ncbi:MAG: T9SS type A sorting domain-containing protein [Ignavibacteria bacterium]|nr:T9SS type A sorting domain-containing protein [Ignavibacteria bacterium]
MKKLFTIVFFLVAVTSSFLAGDRMVFVERFTSWTCGPCASNNPAMESWINSVDADRVVGIAYHMNWPAPGNDGYFLYNPNDNNARRNFYGVNSIPQARMDGLITVNSPYTSGGLQSLFDTRTNLLSPVTMILTDSTFGDSILVRARIYCEVLLSNPSVFVHFSIQERHHSYTSPPGTNGETQFYDIMRRLVNGGNGENVYLYPGQTVIVEKKFYKDPIWNPAEVMPIAWIQQGVEVMNGAKKTANFTMIPTTGFKSVLQGQNQSATYDMTIPIVAAGYNSPVTLTAQVDPPNAGISVSFPSGGTVSTFPGNFTVQVNSTGAVPTGNYRIIVTGTNGNGKTHKTSVSYLVGMNYVGVNTNRILLAYKVNGTTYTSPSLFAWNVGSSQQLSAVSPQIFGSTRYLFQNWSNAGDTINNITISTGVSNYTCNYRAQYKLITSVSPAVGVTVNGGNLFYDSAATVNFSPSATTVIYNDKTYYFQRWVGAGNNSYNGTNPNGTITSMSNVIVQTAQFDTIVPFGIQNLNTGIPNVFALHQNYPNPFNPVTKIKFDIPKFANVTVKVYDVIGNEIAQVFAGDLAAGYYEADFNASSYASGVYFYRIDAGDYSSVKRMVLVK